MADFTWGGARAQRWIFIGLAVSLTFNLLLVGGYLYQRHVVYPQQQAAWAARALNLDATQQQDLLQLNAWAKQQVKAALDESKPDFTIARAILRDGQADDARLGQALRRISERRLQLQAEALTKVIAFRDSLSPEQRQTFARLSAEPKFALRLLGLVPLRTEFNE